jgi:hypothetical protein
MRYGSASRTGLVLARTPNLREQAARRRLLVVCAVLGLALASGVIGALTPSSHAVQTGPSPFSFFPSL